MRELVQLRLNEKSHKPFVLKDFAMIICFPPIITSHSNYFSLPFFLRHSANCLMFILTVFCSNFVSLFSYLSFIFHLISLLIILEILVAGAVPQSFELDYVK